jgi:3-carboxy-cis,cis-muconate cycloisomerase
MFSTPAMRQVFSAQTCLQRMLDFEAALASAEARVGVIPANAAEPIAASCDAARLDWLSLANAAVAAGNLAIPLVKRLTGAVLERDTEAAKYVHWGATSQDVIDSGLVLQLRDALDLIDADLAQLAAALAQQAQRHRNTLMVGRTWLQHALPITFGLKVAGWLDAVLRHHERLKNLRPRLLVLQFGGAAGTLASLGDRGLQVATALAENLQLGLPDTPWHTHRDRIVEVATLVGMLAGTLGKIARDISLLMQTDVAEAAEPVAEGRGGSSTMPHKRNPIGCAATLSAAIRVPALVSTMLSGMLQEHERGLGGWQAEWDTLPEIMQLTAGALEQMKQVGAGLTVDAQHMRDNLNTTRGQIMAEAVVLALGAKMGRMAAHELVEKASHDASASGRQLWETLAQEPGVQLSPAELDRLLDPSNYLGQTADFIDRVLATYDRTTGLH